MFDDLKGSELDIRLKFVITETQETGLLILALVSQYMHTQNSDMHTLNSNVTCTL